MSIIADARKTCAIFVTRALPPDAQEVHFCFVSVPD